MNEEYIIFWLNTSKNVIKSIDSALEKKDKEFIINTLSRYKRATDNLLKLLEFDEFSEQKKNIIGQELKEIKFTA